MQPTPVIAIHLSAALAATVIGPFALWARRGRTQRPRLHRTLGYAWVTLMIATAVSALFIHGNNLPHIYGYGPIHLLIPIVFVALFGAFWYLARGNIACHRRTMQITYVASCVVAGGFTLLPGRYLGQLVWGEWLGLLSPGAARPGMLAGILGSTPFWVWALLAGLLILGYSQTRPRQTSPTRTLAMGALSFYGTVSALGTSVPVLAGWLLSTVLAVACMARLPATGGTHYDAIRRVIELPGSWVPMLLILGIFLTKYSVGVGLALRPALQQELAFALPIAMLYGLFTGLFAGRALRLLRLVLAAHRSPAPTLTPATQA